MSKIQTIIIPRNWLFGRLCYMRANLINLIKVNPHNFTILEKEKLEEASKIIDGVISNKKENSEVLKKLHRKV